MIDRYVIEYNSNLIKKIINSEKINSFDSEYNAAPTKSLPIVSIKSPNKVDFVHWGATSDYAKKKPLADKLISLDLSTFSKSNMHYNLLISQRCIILCNGFYLWKKTSRNQKTPYYFNYIKDKIMLCVGIKEKYEDFEGNTFNYFSFISKKSSNEWKEFSDTIPFVLDFNNINLWFDKNKRFDEILDLIYQPEISSFNYYTVSPFIKDLSYNDKKLISPKNTSNQHGNYSLFD